MPTRRLPKTLAAPFVVTVSTVGLGVAATACHDASSPPNEPTTTAPKTTPTASTSANATSAPTTTPPGADKPPASDIDPVTGRPATSFSFPKAEKIASPTDPKTGETIAVDAKGSCWVHGKQGDRVTVACPPGLDTKEWAKKCADQLVQQRGTKCQCEIFANPPYVGEVPCPEHR